MKHLAITLSVFFIVSLVFAQNNSVKYDLNGNSLKSTYHSKMPKPASPSESGWTSVGPYGGDVLDLAIDPTNTDYMFAAAGYPYMRNGSSSPWMIMENLYNLAGNIHCIEATANGVIFAGGNYTFGKIFRSDDDGATWTQKSLPYNSGMLNIAVDPSDPDIIYAAMSSNLSLSQNKVIVKSDDGGETWSAFDLTSIFPVGWGCVYIAVDPEHSDTIFAIGNQSFSNAMVIASFDGGATWQDKTAGLPAGKPYNSITIANGVVYVTGGQLFGGNTMGVYKSEDYGSSWTNISLSFPNKVANDIIIHPENPLRMYVATEGGGVYYTLNGGLTWVYNTGGTGDNGSVRKLLFLPGDPSTVYAGFLSLGVCYTDDSGANWNSSTVGIAALALNDIEVDPNDSQVILASFEAENSGGCYLFNQSINDWEIVSALPATRFSAVDVGIDGTLYAWSNGPTTVAQEGVYKSTDGGQTWENMGPDIGSVFETQIWTIALSETNPDLIFIGGNNFGANGWASMIYRSVDGGENWDNVFMGPENDAVRFIHIVPGTNDMTVYVAFKTEGSGAGFMKSIDGGTNWLPINDGIPPSAKWGGAIVSDPQNPDMLYGGVGGYGGMSGSVYRSVDAGSNWTATNLTLDNYSKITDLLVSPQNSNVVYAGTSLNGVYLTTDGMNWTPDNEGMPASNVTGFSRLTSDLIGNTIFYASTFTNSAYSTILYDSTTSVGQHTQTGELLRIAPNPSTGRFYIETEGKARSIQKIIISDLAGKVVYEQRISETGRKGLAIETDLNPGIYLLSVLCNQKTCNQKIVIR